MFSFWRQHKSKTSLKMRLPNADIDVASKIKYMLLEDHVDIEKYYYISYTKLTRIHSI